MELKQAGSQRVWSPRARKAGFIALSAFIVWHAVGIAVVGPFAKSELHENLMSVYQYYLPVFHLDRNWPFYAPNPFYGSLLRYETVSANGATQRYPLTEAHKKFEHAYFRYTNLFAYLFSDYGYTRQRGFDTAVANYLCQQHAQSNITAINFILLRQKEFTQQDYISGKRPLDPEFIAYNTFGPYPCSTSNGAAK